MTDIRTSSRNVITVHSYFFVSAPDTVGWRPGRHCACKNQPQLNAKILFWRPSFNLE